MMFAQVSFVFFFIACLAPNFQIVAADLDVSLANSNLDIQALIPVTASLCGYISSFEKITGTLQAVNSTDISVGALPEVHLAHVMNELTGMDMDSINTVLKQQPLESWLELMRVLEERVVTRLNYMIGQPAEMVLDTDMQPMQHFLDSLMNMVVNTQGLAETLDHLLDGSAPSLFESIFDQNSLALFRQLASQLGVFMQTDISVLQSAKEWVGLLQDMQFELVMNATNGTFDGEGLLPFPFANMSQIIFVQVERIEQVNEMLLTITALRNSIENSCLYVRLGKRVEELVSLFLVPLWDQQACGRSSSTMGDLLTTWFATACNLLDPRWSISFHVETDPETDYRKIMMVTDAHVDTCGCSEVPIDSIPDQPKTAPASDTAAPTSFEWPLDDPTDAGSSLASPSSSTSGGSDAGKRVGLLTMLLFIGAATTTALVGGLICVYFKQYHSKGTNNILSPEEEFVPSGQREFSSNEF